jgi:hypothetical protein
MSNRRTYYWDRCHARHRRYHREAYAATVIRSRPYAVIGGEWHALNHVVQAESIAQAAALLTPKYVEQAIRDLPC